MPWIAQASGSVRQPTVGSVSDGKEVGEPAGDEHPLGHATVEVHAECPLLRAQVFVAQPAISTDAAIEMRLDGDEVALPDVSRPPEPTASMTPATSWPSTVPGRA